MSTVRTPSPRGGSTRTSGSGDRRPLLVGLAILAGALAFYLGMLWGSSGDIPANTTVLGVQIGGMERSQAIAALEREIGPLADAPIAVMAYQGSTDLMPAASGLSFDAAATVDAAAGRLYSPLSMLQRLFGSSAVDPVVVVDEAALAGRIDQFSGVVSSPPAEPILRYDGLTPELIPGQDGRGVDIPASVEDVAGAYLLSAGPVPLPETTTEPTVTEEAALEARDGLAATAVSAPVTVDVEGTRAEIPPEVIAEATSFEVRDGTFVPVLDGALLHEAIAQDIKKVEAPGNDATFDVSSGTPVVVPSQVGRGVADEDLAAAVSGVLAESGDARVATAPVTVRDPELTTEEAEKLGIVEEVSSFTQQVNYVDYMAHNLALASKYINGTILEPGEIFSMNGLTENHDPENGYMEGYVIGPGHVFEKALGGGLSAATTTVWSAAFFAGLEPIEVRPHSVYISRYVPGLEATVNWDSFDMQFRNNTPYGIYIQAYSDETSMTVVMYSTKMYTLIDAEVGEPYYKTDYEKIYSDDKKCTGQSGTDGFSIDVDRVFYEGDEVVNRETFTTTYEPAPEVICGEKPAEEGDSGNADDPAADPSDDPSDAPSDQPADEPTDEPTDVPADQPTDTPTEDPGGDPAAGIGDG
ncbi:MAG: VanW family protein [bacterium]